MLQTLRWLLRPIAFMESCRRRFGDTFGVRLLGFGTPLVMLSDPEAIRALYRDPPARPAARPDGHAAADPRRALAPAARGARAPGAAAADAAPFHGERMRAYEATVREVVARDVASWPQREPFVLHPRMQRVKLEVILRAVFGVTEPYAFRPERFLDAGPATFAWVPFGGGVRRCIGAAFAEMEMRVALAEILRHRTLRAATGKAEHVARRNVTFSPAGGTRVIAALRHPGTASGYAGETASGAERLSA